LNFENSVDEVLTAEGGGLFHIEIHVYLKVIVSEEFLNPIKQFKQCF